MAKWCLSDWEGPLGQLNGAEAPFAIQRLNTVARLAVLGIASLRTIDTSGMGPGNDGDGAKKNRSSCICILHEIAKS